MGFGFYRTITVDHTKVGTADSSNIAVLVDNTYSFLATTAHGGLVQNANGFDVGFYADSALTTKLAWEVELYTATTGAVIYWVRIPTLSHTVDTVFYMAYSNPSITTDQSNASGTWDSNYLGVFHLPTVPGTNSITGTAGTNHSSTSVAGQVGQGVGTNATNWLDTGLTPSSITAFTIEAWVNAGATPAGNAPFASSNSAANAGLGIFVEHGTGTAGGLEVFFRAAAGLTRTSSTASIATGVWHHVIGTHAAGANSMILYVDGVATGTATETHSTNPDNGSSLVFGRDGADSTPFAWTGSVDEGRLSNSVRSASYVTAQFNNQGSPTTFYAVGSQVVIIPQTGNALFFATY